MTGHPVQPGTLGNVVVKLPLPPGCLPTLWNADQRFRDAYLDEFPGYYKTADAGFIDEDGYLFIMSRTDDIINVAGHRLSTGAMEEVVAEHPDVAECAVIGIADEMKGQVPCGFIVLNAGVARDTGAIEREVVGLVRERIGPVAAFKTVVTRQAPAEDALRKDPARHHAEDRRPGSSGRCRQRSTIRPSSTRSRSPSTTAASGSEQAAARQGLETPFPKDRRLRS